MRSNIHVHTWILMGCNYIRLDLNTGKVRFPHCLNPDDPLFLNLSLSNCRVIKCWYESPFGTVWEFLALYLVSFHLHLFFILVSIPLNQFMSNKPRRLTSEPIRSLGSQTWCAWHELLPVFASLCVYCLWMKMKQGSKARLTRDSRLEARY